MSVGKGEHISAPHVLVVAQRSGSCGPFPRGPWRVGTIGTSWREQNVGKLADPSCAFLTL